MRLPAAGLAALCLAPAAAVAAAAAPRGTPPSCAADRAELALVQLTRGHKGGERTQAEARRAAERDAREVAESKRSALLAAREAANRTLADSAGMGAKATRAKAEADAAVAKAARAAAQADATVERVARERAGLEKRAARVPPYYWHGEFSDQDFDLHYPLGSVLAELAPRGDYARTLPLMHKLEAGGTARVLVFGGSMTAGNGCGQGRWFGDQCAWSARFASWLRTRFPRARIELINLARGGQTADGVLSQIGVELRANMAAGNVDLVMLDTLVNDAARGATLAYEGLIRYLHQRLPGTPVVSVLSCPAHVPGSWTTGCAEQRAEQLRVIEHYGVPYVDFKELVDQRPALWQCPADAGSACTHPQWKTHQFIADVAASAFGAAWSLPKRTAAAAREFPTAPISDAKALAELEGCLEPLSYYSAFDPPTSGEWPKVVAGNWSLYADRPRKPGWISETAGSRLRFRLQFGRRPIIVVNYLRSYEGLGSATVHLNGHQERLAILPGLWDRGFALKVSQTDTKMLPLDKVPVGTAKYIAAGSSADIDVVNLGQHASATGGGDKFKITFVGSC